MGLKFLLFPLLIISFLSCESKLYPPTDPPVLSDLILTSDSYRSATNRTYENDTVFLTVAVTDPEDDPLSLSLSVLSAGTEVLSQEYGESRIHDGSSWEGWFDTTGLAVGTYSLVFTAVDKEGNISNTLTQSFDIEADVKSTLTTADISISGVSVALKDAVPDEPYTITFTVSNNHLTVDIDRVHVPFTVTITYDNGVDPPVVSDVEGVGVIPGIPALTSKVGYLKLNIQTVNTTAGAPVFNVGDCIITIY